MSYILDALKKAERERGISQVPTLATVHEVAARPRMRMWIASGILVTGLALVLWLVIPRMYKGIEPIQSGTAAPNLEEESAAAKIETSPLQVSPIAAPEDPELSEEIPRDEMRTDAAPDHTQFLRSRTLALSEMGKLTAGDRRPAQPARPATAPAPGISVPENFADDTADDLLSSTDTGNRTNSTQSSGKTQGSQVSLREAMAGMSISILSFSENKSERFVFINGRKYFEGDYVQDEYLLESITPDGAGLSHKGERAILRPDSK
jgi:general secretion pathway protein B